MQEQFDSNEYNYFIQGHRRRVKISNLYNDISLNRKDPQIILKNLSEIIDIVKDYWDFYTDSCFSANQTELLFTFLKDKELLDSEPQIRDLTIYILSHGASGLLSSFNYENKITSVENIMILLEIIANPHNNNEMQNAITLLKYIMNYTTNKLGNGYIADYLAKNVDKFYPSVICFIVEKLSLISEQAAEILENYLLGYIIEHHDIIDDFVHEQLSYSLAAIAYLPKVSENNVQVYAFMEEYLQSNDPVFIDAGLKVAQTLTLKIETIKNSILGFLDSQVSSILIKTIGILIANSAVWENDEECCDIIINKLNDLLNFGNGKVQNMSIDLMTCVDPKSCRITEDIIDTLIEMLATNSRRSDEILKILVNFAFNIRRGTIECDINLDDFQNRIWENEIYIDEFVKHSPNSQGEYQKLMTILQA